MKVLIASNNEGKIKEFKALFARFGATVCSLKDLDLDVDVPETGTTFRENAALKAETLSHMTGMLTLADDSGLCVDALNGAPGIYSARYAGPDKNSEHNIDLLLSRLKNIPETERTAHFICVLAISQPNGPTHFAEGRCEGMITMERRGTDGFGYDPVFLLPDRNRTFAQMGHAEKNKISHRALALEQLRKNWTSWVGASK
ncbi:XTP/dITP diphosphatase [Sporolactobacillus sp. CPB3-1]|uniref:dITP/XTP pyrophosphatase n=1 Tax=Sporolactobacillus mangiferae TaxID=2940498 RepID=A0ABT0M6R4_9BACL|nr:XTP/dITP diphosphatase [Sporolactobacillus mangiferae]MCL1630555.1 XTP/dITP diphosphatase [Sporolactobacillus mangiferae]